MPSHSAAETVDDAPADSAVSVVGTGVWLVARPDAILLAGCWCFLDGDGDSAQGAMLELSRRELEVATGPCAGGRRIVLPIPAATLGSPHSLTGLREHSPTICQSSHCSRHHSPLYAFDRLTNLQL